MTTLRRLRRRPSSTISKNFSSETLGKSLGSGNESFFFTNGLGHMTKMVLMAINSKTFKNLLLQNQKAYDFETWPNALERERSSSKFTRSWDHLYLFYDKANPHRSPMYLNGEK